MLLVRGMWLVKFSATPLWSSTSIRTGTRRTIVAEFNMQIRLVDNMKDDMTTADTAITRRPIHVLLWL